LLTVTVAVLVPTALGSKVMVKVVVPVSAATGLVASVVSVKSPAWAPPMATRGLPVKLSVSVPEFAIVNVLETVPPARAASPKSVLSVAVGLVSLSAID